MNCNTYAIIVGDNVIAKGMPIETAMILLKALFMEYWQDPVAKYTIEREAPAECEEAT